MRSLNSGTSIDELYVEAIESYVKAHKETSAGALRNRAATIRRGAPQISVQIPEELYKRADVLGKRLEKRRDALYSEALTRHILAKQPAGDSAFGTACPMGPGGPSGKRPNRPSCPACGLAGRG